MKVKLLFPPAYEETIMSMLPLGMPQLTAYLRKNNIELYQDDLLIKIRNENKNFSLKPKINLEIFKDYQSVMDYLYEKKVDLEIENNIKKILKLTNFKGYDLIGFSIMSKAQFSIALCMAKKLKEETKSIIIFGGSLITSYAYLYYRYFNFIDYMIRGDGEKPLVDLIYFLSNKKVKEEKIPGLVYRKNSKIMINSYKESNIENSCIPDFDDLPLNLYKININGKKTIIIPYKTSSGCLNRCTFCSHYIFHEPQYKSCKKVVSEMSILATKYNSDYFYFCDSTLNLNSKNLNKICKEIIKLNSDYKWVGGYLRPDNLNNEILSNMRKSGCSALFFGVESGSDRVLKHMNKGFSIETVKTVIKKSYSKGILNSIFIIVDYPTEAKDDFKKTLEVIKINSKYIFDVIPQLFHVDYNTIIKKNPDIANIKNIRLNKGAIFRDIEGNNFKYDEKNGLKWEGIIVRQSKKLEELNRVIYNNIRSKQDFFVKFVPFDLYKLRYNRKSIMYKLIEYYKNIKNYNDPWGFHFTACKK